MIYLKTPAWNAESVKNYLLGTGNFSRAYKAKRDGKNVLFPVNTADSLIKRQFPSACYVKSKGKRNKNADPKGPGHNRVPYDIIGDILILNLPVGFKNEKRIAVHLLKAHKNIRTILKKKGEHKGEFRLARLEYLLGERKTETTHRENNTEILVDVSKVYFSPRLSSERKRICEQIKKGEKILVMFSGCGIYPLVIARNTQAAEIVGVEKNRAAHKYALLNAGRCKNIRRRLKFICGDVRKIVPQLHRFDRILMPLPKTSDTFLDLVLPVSKKGTIVHYYTIKKEVEINGERNKLRSFFTKCGKKIKSLSATKCGHYSPRTFRYCIDFQIG